MPNFVYVMIYKEKFKSQARRYMEKTLFFTLQTSFACLITKTLNKRTWNLNSKF